MASEDRNCVKMSGYLEKKGKMRMLSSWKNYWFVLEGRLLLYYRSKDEYDALSPCKGSISLSPICAVKPLLGTSCVFQIETRVNNIILKAKNRLEQDKWMHALLAALNQSPNSANGMLHFRYSSDELMPRRTAEDKNKFSRQYTLPQRLNFENRHTLCRSFETIRPNLQKDPLITKRPSTSRRINQAACSSSEQNVNEVAISGTMTENTIYDTVPEYLREKLENPDHIYERISSDSRLCDSFREMVENDTYATTTEIETTRLLNSDEVCINNDMYVTKPESNSEDIIVDNVEYCTPDITVRDTNLVSYHEYNIPDRDYIYSEPNIEGMDHNENTIPSRTQPDVNPYSVCHIYPKSKSLIESRSVNKDDMFDNVMEYAVPCRKSDSHVSKLLQKLRKATNAKEGSKNSNITKKSSFLQKLFRRQPRSPKKTIRDEKVEEIEYAEINVENENAGKKLENAYCIDKKLLQELELLLNVKKRHLQEILNDKKEDQNAGEASTSAEPQAKQLEADRSVKHRPKIPKKVRKKKNVDATQDTTNENLNNFKSIDEILDELEQMKKEDCITSGKVRKLIKKFDRTVKTKDSRLEDFNSYGYDIVVRRKNTVQEVTDSIDRNNSSDELNRLLSELAKVTNAPIMIPGVTNSLSVTSRIKDPEFIGLTCKNERRLSEPDYDIPRPHTNLRISRDKYESDEDVLPATRFFGPALPNYESKASPPLCSMAPDSLEFEISPTTTIEASLPSYSSHKYDIRRKSTNQMEKRIPKEEVFVDSLEPQDEVSTIL